MQTNEAKSPPARLFENRIERLLSRKELAAFLGVSLRTVDNLMRQGLPRIVIASRPRFDVVEVKEWLRTIGA